eukprot:Skav230041  [mRNA]  locus=scaffold465:187346:189591:+ [translate_table: standard]
MMSHYKACPLPAALVPPFSPQELNDKRAAEEERKQLEMEARQKLEKQLAKEEPPGGRGFHKQQLEMKNKQTLRWDAATGAAGCPTGESMCPRKQELKRQKEAYERQVREAEHKHEMEREKAEKREQDRAGGDGSGAQCSGGPALWLDHLAPPVMVLPGCES